jgi:hypothetical protein
MESTDDHMYHLKKGTWIRQQKPNIGNGTALHYKTVVKRAYILHFLHCTNS